MKWNVTVIIPVYNAEKYIEEGIYSILNQPLKGIEIIIINDGSTDRTVEIIEKIQLNEKNIVLLHQENAGPSAARNKGLEVARGKYVTFLDADDYYPAEIFKKIYDFLEKNNADMFVGNILCFNDVRQWNLPYMKKVFNQKSVYCTSLTISPEIQESPSVCNKWFKNELIKDIRFEEDIRIGEDLLFTQQSYLQAKKIALANWNVYCYRVMNVSTLSKNKEIHFFKQLVDVQERLIYLFIVENRQEELTTIIHRQALFFVNSIYHRMADLEKEQLEQLIEWGIAFFTLSKPYLNGKLFDDIERHFFVSLLCKSDRESAHLFLNLLKEPKSKEHVYEENHVYSYLANSFPAYKELLIIKPTSIVKVEDICLEGWNLTLSGYAFLKGFPSDQQKKTLVFTNRQTSEERYVPLENELRTDLTYLYKDDGVSYDWSGFQTTTLRLDDVLGERMDGHWDVEVLFEVNHTYTSKEKLSIPLAEIKNKAKVQYERMPQGKREIRCFFENGKDLSIAIIPSSTVSYVKSRLRSYKNMVNYDLGLLKRKKYKTFTTLMIYKTIGWYIRKQKLWLMGERPDTAQDNTYHLYNYIRKNHPAIGAYYVIKKDSPDYERMKSYGNIIEFGSIKHTLYLLCSACTINSYLDRPNMYTAEYIDIIKYYPHFMKNKKIFLQHGVIGVSRVNHSLHKNRANYDMFVTSSQFEKDHIVKEFGYREDQVVITGLARWDNLDANAAKKKILLMPTWRSWIKSGEELLQSEYFNRYIRLLFNDKLINLLETHKYELTFYPHYQTQKILADNNYEFHERIHIVKQGEQKVQDLLNSHQLLITDYSTVSFDFGYMKKPVIFYQFDYDDFYSKHYNEGPINHKKELFGAVCEEEEDVISSIEKLLSTSVEMSPSEEDLTNRYMSRTNKQHCEMIYEQIERVNQYV
ncbi:MAG: glycosyltransferase [Bacillaceae bacterium]